MAASPVPFESILMRLFEARRLSPPGRDILEVTLRSGLRTSSNWLIPVLSTLLAAILLAIFRVSATDGFGSAFGRIFLFDYLLFLLAWVSGWNMSRRWRMNADLVEELTLTNMRPRHTTLAASSGVLGAWFYCLAILAVAEVIIFFGSKTVQAGLDPDWAPGSTVQLVFETTLVTAMALPPILVFAWFHFESVRLAHTMFALGALPRVPLGTIAVTNFFAIAGYVALLSGIGCIVTGIVCVPLLIVVAIFDIPDTSFGRSDIALELFWLWPGMIGMWSIILMKRSIAKLYQSSFDRRWAMFQWWGAGEIDHPAMYPTGYERAANLWALFHHAEEVREAPGVAPREVTAAERRYLHARHAVLQSPVEPRAAPQAPERMT